MTKNCSVVCIGFNTVYSVKSACVTMHDALQIVLKLMPRLHEEAYTKQT